MVQDTITIFSNGENWDPIVHCPSFFPSVYQWPLYQITFIMSIIYNNHHLLYFYIEMPIILYFKFTNWKREIFLNNGIPVLIPFICIEKHLLCGRETLSCGEVRLVKNFFLNGKSVVKLRPHAAKQGHSLQARFLFRQDQNQFSSGWLVSLNGTVNGTV